MTPAVSIVIPSRNDAEALARTLDHLEPHIWPDIEVIVAATALPSSALSASQPSTRRRDTQRAFSIAFLHVILVASASVYACVPLRLRHKGCELGFGCAAPNQAAAQACLTLQP